MEIIILFEIILIIRFGLEHTLKWFSLLVFAFGIGVIISSDKFTFTFKLIKFWKLWNKS